MKLHLSHNFALGAALCFCLGSANAATLPPVFSTSAGAIRGYDPVAYFTQNKAVKGRAQLRYNWQGADWHFSSQANLESFKQAPEKYAPQYGGYCAYGVAQGYAPEIDPQAFQVHNGKLYLNLSKRVLKKWQQDIPTYVRDADTNWPQLKAGTYVEK